MAMGKYECVVLELELTDVDTHWRIKKKIVENTQ